MGCLGRVVRVLRLYAERVQPARLSLSFFFFLARCQMLYMSCSWSMPILLLAAVLNATGPCSTVYV